MKIQTKYSIGQEICLLIGTYKEIDHSVKCPNCKGKHTKTMNKGTWRCSECNNGYLNKRTEILRIGLDEHNPYKVQNISVFINEKGIIEEEHVNLISEENWSSHFSVFFGKESADDWIDLQRDRGVKKGCEFQTPHLTLKSAEDEYSRVLEFVDKYNEEHKDVIL